MYHTLTNKQHAILSKAIEIPLINFEEEKNRSKKKTIGCDIFLKLKQKKGKNLFKKNTPEESIGNVNISQFISKLIAVNKNRLLPSGIDKKSSKSFKSIDNRTKVLKSLLAKNVYMSHMKIEM